MKEEVLNKLKEKELDILKEVDRVCKKNNIKYFIMYGTLLGAVRHQGFIPWDDDIDICMLRSDYEKFLEIASKELDEKFFVDYEKTNKKYYLPFAKVRNKNTQVFEEASKKYDGHKGIWIDIFPYDYKKKNSYNIIDKIKFKIFHVFHVSLVKKSLKKEYSKKVSFVANFLSYKFIFRWKKILSIHKKREKYVLHYGLEKIYETPIIAVNDIFPLKKYKFEDCEFYGPKNADKILTDTYGDYMQLPPVEKRITHSIEKVIFDD